MLLTMMKSKIHRATITGADLNYEGSISIDKNLIKLASLHPYEQVQVVNINNGNRFETYVIEAPAGSGEIALNGAAARLGFKGDKIIIIAYCQLTPDEIKGHTPIVVKVDDVNKPR